MIPLVTRTVLGFWMHVPGNCDVSTQKNKQKFSNSINLWMPTHDGQVALEQWRYSNNRATLLSQILEKPKPVLHKLCRAERICLNRLANARLNFVNVGVIAIG
mmetsp:Transcript_63906/g.122866  ORF Transcript_63906/g.122866 Transcript_63906/m.122866 type:complete len:103 (+) Transcript_63906:232-540(+)